MKYYIRTRKVEEDLVGVPIPEFVKQSLLKSLKQDLGVKKSYLEITVDPSVGISVRDIEVKDVPRDKQKSLDNSELLIL